MRLDPYLLAHIEDWADRTARPAPGTDMLAKWHQEAIDFYPVLRWEHGFQCGHGLFWGTRLDISPAVGDAVDMNIHANAGLLTPDAQHQVGTFGAHASQGA